MRRRCAQHDHGPLRAVGAARRSPRAVRRVARRQQGEQRPQGRAQLRLRRQGLQVRRARKAVRAGPAGDPLLELQPLRRPRRVQERQGLPERSRAGTARDRAGGARRFVLRRRDDVQEGPGIQEGRRAADDGAGAAAAAGGVRNRVDVHGDLRAVPGHSGPGHPDLHAGVHRRLPGPRPGVDGAVPDDVHGRHARRAGRAHLAAEVLSAAAGVEARAHHVDPVLQPHPPPAVVVLRAAVRRRDRLARADQRQGRQDHLGQAGVHGHRPCHDDFLFHPDVFVQRQPDADRDGDRPAQRRRRAALGAERASMPAAA